MDLYHEKQTHRQGIWEKTGVAKIDLAKVPNQIVETGQGFGLSSKARMLKAWAANQQEVLIQGSVPGKAVKLLR